MIIRYFDKDGKEHRLKLNRPVYICSEIGHTGTYAETKIEEQTRFNKQTEQYETSGCITVAPASEAAYPFGLCMSGRRVDEFVLGPVKQM